MSIDAQPVAVPGVDERFVVVARWDGGRWAVSVPNYGGKGGAGTYAEALAEVVPTAAVVIGALIQPRPADLASRIDVNMHLDPELVECYTNARDPYDAAAILRDAGLPRDDIDTLVLSRLYAVIAPAPGYWPPRRPMGSER